MLHGYSQIIATAMVAMFLLIDGNARKKKIGKPESTPNIVTADIQAGIEAHIARKAKEGDGYFRLDIDGATRMLRLVKIHTEYLASIAYHETACVDLVDTNGDVFDVDFFMHGNPGSMVVSKTKPHKFNGKPYFFWKQNDDETWGRVKLSQASGKLMGIIVPKDSFEFRYQLTLPEISGKAQLWIPLPRTDRFQKIKITKVIEPKPHRILADGKYGNQVVYWELDSSAGGRNVDLRYAVDRIEVSAYKDKTSNPKDFLSPNLLIPRNSRFKDIATETTRNDHTDYQRAKSLYKRVIKDIRYAKAGKGWGQGNAEYACDARHGNCTDFHSYFIALARSINIPARFAIGAAIPSNRNDGGVDGYHCWAEFFADGKWWPVDISEADKYSRLEEYYFGHFPANRIELSRGRDIELDPGPKSGSINFLAYPILEVNGRQVKVPVIFSFKRNK
ncbi:MAG: transglutaminase domain-containing protein [Kiritimatiellaeota bacterium]|nr:transglutaminase domain-containing protein [Kiritimatiellota bacterium]